MNSTTIVPLILTICGAMSFAPLQAAESWAFTPGDDAFAAEAVLDLRALNEPIAGEKGFIARSKDGNDFVLGDGSPARFWAMNASCKKPEDMAYEAHFLAKRGVNLVRVFADVRPDPKANPAAKIGDANRGTIDNIWRWVAALKHEGIYSLITPYWATGDAPASWGIRGQGSLWGVLFSDRTMQDGFKEWMRVLYGEKNPYTGVPLSQEPAIAVILLQNEDSLLFWTIGGFLAQKGQPYDELRAGFGAFATTRHGSIAKALEAWGGSALDGDDAEHGMIGLLGPWNMMNPNPAEHGRAIEQVEFMATTMRDFNAGMETFLRKELGCKQLINAANWRPADAVKLFDSERWAYGANQVTAVNRYLAPYHHGPNEGWALEPGDHFANQSCTLEPTALPLNCKQPAGSPFVVTETGWVLPDLYQAEAPLMAAAYCSLTGLDAVFWLGHDDRSWHEPIWPWGKMFKWPVGTPTTLGQFPAAALLYRKGYAKTGEVVVHEERALDDLWNMRTPLIAEEAGYDPNRDAGLPAASSVKTTVDPLAFLVGRVEVVYGGDPAKNRVIDLSKLIDPAKKTVTSVTGEERIDHATGLFTLDTPKAQAAAGMLGKVGPVKLHDITISCANPYAAISVVALDDRPLHDSAKILVQVGTTIRPTGWKEHEDEFEVDEKTHQKMKGFTIDAIGANPWQVEKAIGTIAFANATLSKATALDANMMRTGAIEGKAANGVFTMTLPADTMYVVVEKQR